MAEKKGRIKVDPNFFEPKELSGVFGSGDFMKSYDKAVLDSDLEQARSVLVRALGLLEETREVVDVQERILTGYEKLFGSVEKFVPRLCSFEHDGHTFVFDPASKEIKNEILRFRLSPNETHLVGGLLVYGSGGTPATSERIQLCVWGKDWFKAGERFDSTLTHLRGRLREFYKLDRQIVNVPGKGYKFDVRVLPESN